MNSTDVNESQYFIARVAHIVSANEGSFGSINQYDGRASSIGLLQWNGSRAKKLLKLIISKNKEHAKVLLSETDILDTINRDDEFWDNKILDSIECEKIRKLLITKEGMDAQNELLKLDINTYIWHGKNLGITDAKALAFFADLENQVGCYTAEDVIKTIDSEKELTMFNILNACVQYPPLVISRERRLYTYTKIMNTDF